MSSQPLRFSLPMVRKTAIFSLSGLLVIFWSIRASGLRGINCTSALYDKPSVCLGNMGVESVFWGLVIALIVWELIDAHQTRENFFAWRYIWPVIPFLILAVTSTIWSIDAAITLSKSLFLVAVSAATVFLLFRFGLGKWIDMLAVFFAAIVTSSLLLVFLVPSLGTMQIEPYNGAWCGIFWHRNYLGSYMAIANTIFLIRLLSSRSKNLPGIILNLLFLVASLVLAVGSRSAGGIFTLAALLILTLAFFLWTKIQHRLTLIHYIILGSAAILILLLVLFNLDFIFGLLNRNTSLTGRVPLWNILFRDFISNRFFLGHGFGAIWNFQEFRLQLQSQLGWRYPVLIGDNGLIDIFLHLGLLGTGLMVLLILTSLVKSIKLAFTNKDFIGFFPLISMVFVIMSNISLSMLIEVEYLAWVLVISALYYSNPSQYKKTSLRNN